MAQLNGATDKAFSRCSWVRLIPYISVLVIILVDGDQF